MQSHNIKLSMEALIIDKVTGKVKRRYEQSPDNGEAMINITTMDVNGNVKQKIEQPSKSFVSNFARLLNQGFLSVANNSGGAAIDQVILTTTGGAGRPTGNVFKMDVLEAALTSPTQSYYGIWVGDKDNQSTLGLTLESGIQGSEGFDDYRLRGTLVADGGSPDTGLEYRTTQISFSGGDTLKISRRFQNDSAANIVISEAGIVGKSGTDYFLLARDIVADAYGVPLTLAPADIVVVEYSYAITAASGFVRNYLKMIESLMKNGSTSTYPVVDVNGNSYTVNFNTARTQLDLLAGDTVDTHGIVISGNYQGGSPITVVNSTIAHKLTNTKWPHSSSFTYSPVSAIALTQNSSAIVGQSYTQFGLTRDFENVGLQGPLEIYEAALYLKEAAATHYFMIAKSGFSPYPVVSSGEILRINAYFKFLLQNTIAEWSS